jgi:hypothetical protein
MLHIALAKVTSAFALTGMLLSLGGCASNNAVPKGAGPASVQSAKVFERPSTDLGSVLRATSFNLTLAREPNGR